MTLKPPGPTQVVGANITKNATTKAGADAVADHAAVATALDGAVDFLVVNASCPNVKGGVVSVGDMGDLLMAARKASPSTPLLLKCSPDLGPKQREAVAKLALKLKLDGLVLANTTSRRPDRDSDGVGDAPRRLFAGPLKSPILAPFKDRGGLSGPPLRENARLLVSDMYRLTKGRVPLVGVGGVASGQDAYALVRAGASLVQLYTALVYNGPSLGQKIRDDLAALAKRDGFSSVQAAVGADHAIDLAPKANPRKRRGWFD